MESSEKSERSEAYSASAPVKQPSAAAIKAIVSLAGAIVLGTLVQAATAGVFVRESHHQGWINVHSVIADLVALLTVGAVVVAIAMWRGRRGGSLVIAETLGLLVAVVAEIVIGSQIGGLGKSDAHPGLLVVHIPLALIIFGLALHVSTYVARRAV